MNAKNPIAYINNLRGTGASLRSSVDTAAEIQAKIARLQADLESLVASTEAQVRHNWTAAEIAEAKKEANL